MPRIKQLHYIACRQRGTGKFLILGRDHPDHVSRSLPRQELFLPYVRCDMVTQEVVRGAVSSEARLFLENPWIYCCSFRAVDGFGNPFPRVPFVEAVVSGFRHCGPHINSYRPFWFSREEVDFLYSNGFSSIRPEVMTFFGLEY